MQRDIGRGSWTTRVAPSKMCRGHRVLSNSRYLLASTRVTILFLWHRPGVQVQPRGKRPGRARHHFLTTRNNARVFLTTLSRHLILSKAERKKIRSQHRRIAWTTAETDRGASPGTAAWAARSTIPLTAFLPETRGAELRFLAPDMWAVRVFFFSFSLVEGMGL